MLGVLGLSRVLLPAAIRALRSPRSAARSHVAAFQGLQAVGIRLLSSDCVDDVTTPTILDIPRKARMTVSAPKEPASFDVRTLHPEKLTPDDYISIKAARREIGVRFRGSASSGSTSSHAHSLHFPTPTDTKVRFRPGVHETFPAGLQGFLYYWCPPSHITPLAGEVRFRQTASSDPSSFAQGEDYHLRMGLPWAIPLFNISYLEGFNPCRDVLLRDRLVSVDAMKSAQHSQKKWARLDRVVHSFYQPFIVSLRQHEHIFYFLGWRGLHHCRFRNLCNVKGLFYRHQAQPFTGLIVCCFEPSRLPQHAGTRTVVIRVLKEVARIDYRAGKGPWRYIPLPIEGGLLPTFVYWPVEGTPEYDGTKTDVGRPKEDWWAPWSVNVDRTYFMGDMKVLFENQAQP